MDAYWYKGFPKNIKYIKSLYDNGVGYYHLDDWPPDMFAMRIVGEPPIHLDACNDREVDKLENQRTKNSGMHNLRPS